MRWPHLNIRQKIILGFLLPSLCLGALTAFSYSNLRLIEQKTDSVEFIDDIENLILEFRRQEKNFLLYGERESYTLAIEEVDKTAAMLERVDEFSKDGFFHGNLRRLKDGVARYREQMLRLHALVDNGDDGREHTEEVRDIGKNLVLLAQELSAIERANILRINTGLRSQLILSSMAVGLLFVAMFFIINSRILTPLKVIELTTAQIARGDFTPLRVGSGNDEIRQVLEGFNRMVSELEKRQDQLVQAQKLSSIGTLAAGIAHQVNNPLNNISTSAQILEDAMEDAFRTAGCGEVDPMLRKMVGNVERETVRARDIVRGLLEFSRHTDFALRPVALRSVVDTAVQLVSSQVPPQVAVKVDVPEDIVLQLDSQRMGEVLLNLLINAIQAIETPPGEIRVSARPGPEGRVTLAVEDTGKGIAEEDLGSIFDPFFTRKEVGKGTGLGLSVAFGILERLGAKIRVESKLGEGSRFLMDFPVHRPEDGAQTPGQAGRSAATEAGGRA